jgi:hypothetical protein
VKLLSICACAIMLVCGCGGGVDQDPEDGGQCTAPVQVPEHTYGEGRVLFRAVDDRMYACPALTHACAQTTNHHTAYQCCTECR